METDAHVPAGAPVTFRVIDASTWEVAGHEQQGGTEHAWLRHVEEDELYLWKPAHGKREDRSEHLAEKAASELAGLIGVPCAHIELAVRLGVQGCLSRNLQPRGYDRESGEDLIAAVHPGFDAAVKGHEAYTVENIVAVLDGVRGPVGTSWSAFDVFAGYLVFDALVLNRDRHARNWLVMRRRDGSEPDRLAPMFDNASSLALSLGESSRSKRLGPSRVAAYAALQDAARAFAHRDGHVRRLLDVAQEAVGSCTPLARQHWLDQIAMLDGDAVAQLLDRTPGLSADMRTFSAELVRCNAERILRAC